MSTPKVAVLRTRPETVLDDYRTLLRMAELDHHLDRTRTTLLKPQLGWHLFMPGANTPPWQLEGTTRALLDLGYRDLAVVQGRTPGADAYRGEQFNHFVSIFNKYHLEVRYAFEPADMRWEPYEPKAKMRILDRLYPRGLQLPDFLHGKNIVHLPTVRTDQWTTTAGAMVNAFDVLIDVRLPFTPEELHPMLVDLLALQREIHPGMCFVMDGTTCGNGPGPRTVYPVIKDLLLASTDPVALDAVAARIMGFDPLSIDYLRMADEAGLGIARFDGIEVVGEDVTELNFRFSAGEGLTRAATEQLQRLPLERMRGLLSATPLPGLLSAGSRLYHDRVWYPVRGRERVRRWEESGWGHLFHRYGAESGRV